VVTTGAISHAKLQSNHHHQQTNIQFLLQAGCPSCRLTNSVNALKGKYHIPWTCLPQAHLGGLPTLSLTTNSSWLPWGRVAMPLISPLMPIPRLFLGCVIFMLFMRSVTWLFFLGCQFQCKWLTGKTRLLNDL